MDIVNSEKNVTIDDKTPYFNKEKLDKIISDMDNGIDVLSQKEYDLEMEKFFDELEKEYGN